MKRLSAGTISLSKNPLLLRTVLLGVPLVKGRDYENARAGIILFHKSASSTRMVIQVWYRSCDGICLVWAGPFETGFGTFEELYEFAGLSPDGSLLEEKG